MPVRHPPGMVPHAARECSWVAPQTGRSAPPSTPETSRALSSPHTVEDSPTRSPHKPTPGRSAPQTQSAGTSRSEQPFSQRLDSQSLKVESRIECRPEPEGCCCPLAWRQNATKPSRLLPKVFFTLPCHCLAFGIWHLEFPPYSHLAPLQGRTPCAT